MLIESKFTYKSITSLKVSDLPDFVVISGLNGSGKTHLLEGLATPITQQVKRGLGVSLQPVIPIVISANNQNLTKVKLVNHSNFVPNKSAAETKDTINKYVNEVNKFLNDYKKSSDKNIRNTLLSNNQYGKILKEIAKNSEKNIDELTYDDVSLYLPLHNFSDKENFFHQSFSRIFKIYHDKKIQNHFRQFCKEKYGQELSYIEDEEFRQVCGEPPWELVNRIIKEASLDYYIKPPKDINPEAPYQIKLINIVNDAEISFEELSSGEQIIMSLVISLYNAEHEREFPQVLLMDEPDAHLHPSMTKNFLDVVEKVFVKDKSIKVIITTHSPSTVALAPEEALYVMNKTAPRIEKVSKDKALSILTSGVPTLSINYENRRQVFVESKYDVIFYEWIYKKLKNKLVPDISINFISSSIGGSGNCDAVKEVVKQLVNAGNRSVYGIIDWDMKNSSSDYVKVIGQGKRYSIENYIFDPILLAAFLLREKIISRADIGLSESENYTDFDKFDNTKLQNIANFITNKIASKMSCKLDLTAEGSSYISGSKVDLPYWYLRIQGHELEKNIKETFPQLNKFNKEEALKLEIISKIIDDLPNLVPEDFYLLFSEIQNYK